jgi:hypothetical protein
MGAMPALSARQIFSVGNTTYTWEDVALGGILWGDWGGLEHSVRAGIACLKRLEERGDAEQILPEDEVSEAAVEFRYARDLVSAEEMYGWLERWGLDAADWMDHIRRTLLTKKWTDDLDEVRRQYPASDEEVGEVILCAAICSGWLTSCASQLAGRAAAHARLAEAAADGHVEIAADEVTSVAEAFRAKIDGRDLPEIVSDVSDGRLETMARLEIAWRRLAAQLVTPQAIHGQIVSHRLEWTRFSAQTLSLSDPEAAREAILCIREDGRDMAVVAVEAGAALREEDWILEETDAEIHDHLVAAQAGEVLGPLPIKNGFLVVAVLAKQPASPDDPAMQTRAEQTLLTRAFGREIESRVRWIEPLP